MSDISSNGSIQPSNQESDPFLWPEIAHPSVDPATADSFDWVKKGGEIGAAVIREMNDGMPIKPVSFKGAFISDISRDGLFGPEILGVDVTASSGKSGIVCPDHQDAVKGFISEFDVNFLHELNSSKILRDTSHEAIFGALLRASTLEGIREVDRVFPNNGAPVYFPAFYIDFVPVF